MSGIWWGGPALACEVCGHVETGRSLETMFGAPVWYGDYVCTWSSGVVACHWCAARLDALRGVAPAEALRRRRMDRLRTVLRPAAARP